ncbi:MAG: hypothetical protein AAF311_02680 [Pseudomonadota bacterium]
MTSGKIATAIGTLLASLALAAGLAHAQTNGVSGGVTPDLSPNLLIEAGPSDNPNYRRMVFVKYLDGGNVSVAYKAYNRSEFIRIEDDTPPSLVGACANGAASTLDEIEAFSVAEAEAAAAEEPTAITHFCIKGVPGWQAGNRAVWLDPIFDGMPHAARLNN